jgi:crotonobetainyl-CoA:carnitine CoA-transferase CaiB-like acyl-CoA transferase
MTNASRVLEGIKVVELGVVIAGPAAAAILGDWGASVIKIEPPAGDPQRGNINQAYFELDNRGKRSMCLELKSEDGRAIIRRLIDDADVFVSNLRTEPLRRLGLDYETLAASHPRLVYASITGYGGRGPGAGKAGYDIGAYWSRAGLAMALTPRGEVPPVGRPGMGDHTAGLAAAAGVAAALYARERTGRGQHITTSLLRAGTYTLSSDLTSALQGFAALPGMRRMQFNPLLGCTRPRTSGGSGSSVCRPPATGPESRASSAGRNWPRMIGSAPSTR